MEKHELEAALAKLRQPFHPSHITWKPGAVKGDRALAMPYADLRVYMNRLDEVCGLNWSVEYEPWGNDRVICRLTIGNVTRSSTGETSKEAERGEIGGTVAEAQSFKRAAAMFGLGRYLYQLPTGWADFDPGTKKFTDKAKVKLTGILMQHYRRSTGGEESASQRPATPATVDVEFDGPRYNADDPTDDELATIAQWANRTEAEMHMVMIEACKNEHEAKQSLNKVVNAFGGKVTKDNIQSIYVAYLRHNLAKLEKVAT